MIIERKAFNSKKVWGKGKSFNNCYFKGCNIKVDRHSRFTGCFFHECKFSSKTIKGDYNIVN